MLGVCTKRVCVCNTELVCKAMPGMPDQRHFLSLYSFSLVEICKSVNIKSLEGFSLNSTNISRSYSIILYILDLIKFIFLKYQMQQIKKYGRFLSFKYSFWFLVPGSWFLVSSSWFLVPGYWLLVSSS